MWRNYYVNIYLEYSLCFSLALKNWQIKENLVKNPKTYITKENKKSTDFASRSRIHVVWLNHLFTVTIFPFIWPSPDMMFWILFPITGMNKLILFSKYLMNANFAQNVTWTKQSPLLCGLTFFMSRVSFAESDLTLLGGHLCLTWAHASNG